MATVTTLLGLLPLFLFAGAVPFLVARRVRGGLSRALRVYGTVWIAASILFAVFALVAPPGRQLPALSNGLGAIGTLAAVPALGLWPAHWLHARLRRSGLALTALARQMFIFTYRHHRFLGWLVFATATAHGLYFALVAPWRAPRMASGLLAWVVLAALLALGLGFDRAPRGRPARRTLRVWHVLAALLLLGAVFVHV